ncbi:MAG: AAA family ATPase [Slackia sp.]|nr:AAA family ATPase [Slackia sp.]
MKASDLYLRQLHIAAFGRFLDKSAGPFSPGMNVVYGKNETGKTTLNAFVTGVLFGWEKAHGKKNNYRPETGDRSGTLFFADRSTGEVCEVSRFRNADGVLFSPPEASVLLDSIDKDTFSTMFALTSDELRGLEGATDVTAKLLTASAGLDVSPAAILADLDARIASYESRSAAAEHSFVRLRAEEEDCKLRLAEARERSEALKGEYREREELAARRGAATKELSDLNFRIERISAVRAEVARLETAEGENVRKMADCDARLAAEASTRPSSADAPLFDEDSEAAVLAGLDRLESQSARLESRLDAARDSFARARAECEASDGSGGNEHTGKAPVRAALFLAAFLAVAGVGLLAFSLWRGEMPIAAIAAVVAVAGAACGIVATRMGSRSSVVSRETPAFHAMNVARGALESCEQDELMHSLKVKESLESWGLQAAHGSLFRARAIVEASRKRRLDAADRLRFRNETAAARMRCEQEIERIRARRKELLAQCGVDPGQGVSALDQLKSMLCAHRDAAIERMRVSDARLGELEQILSEGSLSNEYDVLKTRAAQIATRKEDSAADLAELLLARRALREAVDAWKSESVPITYRRASELFSLMTNGRWQQVSMDENGVLTARDGMGKRLEPRFLSMGTCQQLYLALRIALLEHASDVGAGLPVLADDILVNFDDERREGAAKALVELSRSRQVVLFTCHKEILDTIRRYAADCTVVAL